MHGPWASRRRRSRGRWWPSVRRAPKLSRPQQVDTPATGKDRVGPRKGSRPWATRHSPADEGGRAELRRARGGGAEVDDSGEEAVQVLLRQWQVAGCFFAKHSIHPLELTARVARLASITITSVHFQRSKAIYKDPCMPVHLVCKWDRETKAAKHLRDRVRDQRSWVVMWKGRQRERKRGPNLCSSQACSFQAGCREIRL